MVGRGTQQDLYGGPPLKTIKKNEGKLPDSVETEISGVKIQLRFAEKESPGIKDRVIEILSDEYEKRRLAQIAIASCNNFQNSNNSNRTANRRLRTK